jgi:predicted nucleic acid-binding protein
MMIRLFLDACIVIDLVEAKPEQQNKLKILITGKQVFGSELVRLESRLQALRDQREDLLRIYDSYFERCKMVPFDRTLFDLASRLRIEHRIKTPDALHLAAALIAECEQFWTNDNHLAKAAGDKLEVWDWNRIEQAAKQLEQE